MFDAAVIHCYEDEKPFLYLGSHSSAKLSASELKEQYGITHILNVTKEIPSHDDTTNIKYLRVDIDDNPRVAISEHFEPAHEFLQQAFDEKTAVLVHCQAGISRSTTIVLSYLMKSFGMNLSDAYYRTKEKRTVISPNIGFLIQLIEYEKKLYGGEPSFSLHEYAVDWIGGFLQEGFDRQRVSDILTKHNDDIDAAMDEVFA
jgi:protein-tyrosine phosphatase